MFIERRLKAVSRRLQRAREDLAVTDEQLLQFVDESDDARLRSIVGDNPASGVEFSESQRHTDAMTRHRADLVATIAKLEAQQDELLDEMTAKRSGQP